MMCSLHDGCPQTGSQLSARFFGRATVAASVGALLRFSSSGAGMLMSSCAYPAWRKHDEKYAPCFG
ncbi:hypothetical protein [Musicola paradisiaca]|uniref:hypothetical protein n=1 Tax=Musicola paradisiaca TaxID=69223 RepID=UPI0003C7EC64|nr:hypothetical protein [Musicola paradisiaca]